MPGFVKVAGVAEIPAGTMKEVEIGGKAIAVANVQGTFFAIDNICLHRGGPLAQGFLEGEVVECPWHGWQWSLKTGQCTFNPEAKLETYEVKVEGSDVLVAV